MLDVAKRNKYLLSKIKLNFYKTFNDRRIAKREWQALKRNFNKSQPKQGRVAAVLQRIRNYTNVSAMQWKNPVHVAAKAVGLSRLDNLQEAINMFNSGKKMYERELRKYIKGNLIISCEIGFDADPDGVLYYNLHAHVICEKSAYEKAKTLTKHWRKGSDQSQHYISTRLCPKKKHQTPTDYVEKVFCYNSKWSINQGDSKLGRKTVVHETNSLTRKYITMKNAVYIRNKTSKQNNNKFTKLFNLLTKLENSLIINTALIKKQLNKKRVLNNLYKRNIKRKKRNQCFIEQTLHDMLFFDDG